MADCTYLMSFQDVEVSYPTTGNGGRRIILNNLDLNIRPGEFLSVVGPTGCGKSTLLRLILGSQFPTQGHVLLDDSLLLASVVIGDLCSKNIHCFLTLPC